MMRGCGGSVGGRRWHQHTTEGGEVELVVVRRMGSSPYLGVGVGGMERVQ